MAPFPLIKLGYLALRQTGRPVANKLKKLAAKSPFYRDRLCIPVAQLYHRWDTSVRMTNLGFVKPKTDGDAKKKAFYHVKPLSEAAAVDLGSEMLGELTVFFVGSAALLLEYWHLSRKADRKKAEEDEYLMAITDNVVQSNVMMDRQDGQLRDLNRHVNIMTDRQDGQLRDVNRHVGDIHKALKERDGTFEILKNDIAAMREALEEKDSQLASLKEDIADIRLKVDRQDAQLWEFQRRLLGSVEQKPELNVI